MPQYKARVLIVEDDADHMQLAKTMLYYANYEVYEAWNGQEGIEKAEQFMPDVILMDIHMPVKDGVTALKELKLNEKTANIPVILLTCFPEHEEICRKIGCESYLHKPFTPYFVETEIKKVLAKANPPNSRKRIY